MITRKFLKLELDRHFKRQTKGNHKVPAEEFLEKLKNILNDNVKEAMNSVCINLNHFKINVFKKIENQKNHLCYKTSSKIPRK